MSSIVSIADSCSSLAWHAEALANGANGVSDMAGEAAR
jgi:hypothetical protein